MSEYNQEDDVHNEETGLNLFDDAASVAGSFPKAMMGYDRASVDNYVREIELQLASLKQLTRHLRRELATAQRATGSDFARLGSHATGILRAAEAQGKELVHKAGLEAERIKEEGRRVAADLRANAQAEADDIRVAGLANLRQLRDDHERDTTETLTKARTEAASIITAAQRQADAIITEASQKGAATTHTAEVEATRLTAEARRSADQSAVEASTQAEQTLAEASTAAAALLAEAKATAAQALADAEKTAAATKQQASDQAEQLLTDAQARHTDVTDRTNQLLAEATRHHEQSSALLTEETEQAAQIRNRALADAEKTKATAARDAEGTIAAAHRQAAMMKDRLEEQYAWRKEQLEREVAALITRKGSIVAQLSNLRQLAGEAPLDYPDDDPMGTSDPRDDQNAAWRTDQGTEPVGHSTGATAAPRPQQAMGPEHPEMEHTTVEQAPDQTQVFDQEADFQEASTTKLADANEATDVIERPGDDEKTRVIKR
ncbi:DivIVA domain-containing protein [Luteococcus sp. H138]|uniref:DivIVA domain-containing protein n=1 Tax=Luteococcus sp. H91 TaxID=3139401 RepID=UPI00313D6AA6